MITLPLELEQQIIHFAQIEQTNPVAIIKRMVEDYHAKHATLNVDATQTEGEKLLATLKRTGFLGSLPDVPNLSANYKEYLDWGDKA